MLKIPKDCSDTNSEDEFLFNQNNNFNGEISKLENTLN